MWFLSRYLPRSIEKTKEANMKEEITIEQKTARRARANEEEHTLKCAVRISTITETGYFHEDDDLSDEEMNAAPAGCDVLSSKL